MASDLRFHWADYLVFSLALVLSSAIGIFYGWRDRSTASTEEFLMAGRKMHFFPVSVSLFVSWMSAISFLGDPVEVYYHGAVYWFISIGYCLAIPAIAFLFVPVYYKLKLTSAYQFLEERFSSKLRPFCSVLSGTCLMIYLSIALYAPSMALSQVSGLSVYIAIVTVGCVCMFYTTIGGMKAVLWADTLQMLVMLGGILAVLIQGSIAVGGFSKVWEIAERGGRLNFNNFNPNPLIRSTFWTYCIGGFFRVFNPYSAEQYFIQRYCSAKSLKYARTAVLLDIPLFIIFPSLFTLLGILMYAYFEDCDPLVNGDITKRDQLLPFMTLKVLSFLPGLPGLFLACIFSAALSTISSGQSGLATMCLHDVVMKLYRRRHNRELSDSTAKWVAKLLCFLLGCGNMGLSFLICIGEIDSIFSISMRVVGMLLGPICGVFITGVLFKFVTSKAIYFGFLSSLAVTLWLGFGSMFNPPPPSHLPTSADYCNGANSTSTVTSHPVTTANHVTASTSTDSFLDSTSFKVEDIYAFSPPLYVAIGPILVALFSSLASGVLYLIYGRHQKKEEFQVEKPDESTEWVVERFPNTHHQQPEVSQPFKHNSCDFID